MCVCVYVCVCVWGGVSVCEGGGVGGGATAKRSIKHIILCTIISIQNAEYWTQVYTK